MLLGCQAQETGKADSGNSTEASVSEQTDPFANVDVDEAKRMIEAGEVIVLDVRTDDEYAAGRIEGAQQINFFSEDFAARIEGLPKDKAYLVYCASGNRSGKAVTKMKELNFQEAHNMTGGINAWNSKSYDTVK